MSTKVLLRIASALAATHCAAHSLLAFVSIYHPQSEQDAVIRMMKAVRFNVLGAICSYYNFLVGFYIFATLALVVEATVLWQVAEISDSVSIRPFIAPFIFGSVAIGLVSWKYFFFVPTASQFLLALFLILAFSFERQRSAVGQDLRSRHD